MNDVHCEVCNVVFDDWKGYRRCCECEVSL